MYLVAFMPVWNPCTSHAEVLFLESVLVQSQKNSSGYKMSIVPFRFL